MLKIVNVRRISDSIKLFRPSRMVEHRIADSLSYQRRTMTEGNHRGAGSAEERRLQFLLNMKAADGELAAFKKLASNSLLAPHLDAMISADKTGQVKAQSPDALAKSASTDLDKAESDGLDVPVDQIPKPTFKQLQQLALISGIPFIGFGFLDNALMILAGDFFDTHLGTILGITTLAAAGMGNMVGDVLGICLGGTIESVALKMGLPDPQLSAPQRSLNSVIVCKTAASIVGILIGACLYPPPVLAAL
jgi:hypothetical protein